MGKGGNDGLFALRGNDNLFGGEGKDCVLGGNKDRPLGGDKNLVGGPGNDLVWGGTYPETAKDVLSAGDGDDVVFVDNATPAKDLVSCGGGFDRVGADSKDVVAVDCEQVFIGAAASRFFHRLQDSGYFVRFFEGLADAE